MKHKKFLDSINVETPCHESWDEMTGNDKIRFCSHCAKDVHNLSAMTRTRAEKIIEDSNGKICVRYAKNPQGETITTAPPKFTQIKRRAVIAAGVIATSLTLSALTYAQGGLRVPKDKTTQTNSKSVTEEVSQNVSTISGLVTDQYGAVIPGAKIILKDSKTNKSQEIFSSDEGTYYFNNIIPSVYEIKVLSNGFKQFTQRKFKVMKNLNIVDKNIVLQVSGEVVGMLVITDDDSKPINNKPSKNKKN